jgi:hypothetical protein
MKEIALSSLPDNQLSDEATVHPYIAAPEGTACT